MNNSTDRFKWSSPIYLNKLGVGVLAYSYGVLLCAAYVLAFWRPLGFEVFSYLSLSDYISAPLGRLSILISVPLVFTVFFIPFGVLNSRYTYYFVMLLFFYTQA